MAGVIPGPLVEKITELPPNKRYIVTHDESGRSIIHSSPPQLYNKVSDLGGAARSFATTSVPANLTNDADVTTYLAETGPTSYKNRDIVIPTASGSHLVVIDLAPGAVSGMHRTVSIDYSICVIGHIRMELDGGEWIDLKPSDHVIQRGTMHKWYNGSQTEPARLIAVTLPCEPFEIPGTGKLLTEEHLPDTPAAPADGGKA